MLKRWAIGVAGTALVASLAAPSAQAAPLLPGTDLTPVPVVVYGTTPGYTGGVVLATTSGPDDTSPVDPVAAFFWAAVVRNSLGTLDFLYQVRNDSTAEIINRETDVNFAGFTTDVVQSITAPGASFQIGTQQAMQADRSADGSTVGFLWRSVGTANPQPLLDPGEISYVKIIRTNATFFTTGRTQAIDGGIAGRNTFAPAVPEPGSMLLLGTGLIGLGARARRYLRK